VDKGEEREEESREERRGEERRRGEQRRRGGRVSPLHEALALRVAQDPSFPARPLRDETPARRGTSRQWAEGWPGGRGAGRAVSPGAVDAGRVELHELEVLQGQSSNIRTTRGRGLVLSQVRGACRGSPARATIADPSPVHVCADVAEYHARPYLRARGGGGGWGWGWGWRPGRARTRPSRARCSCTGSGAASHPPCRAPSPRRTRLEGRRGETYHPSPRCGPPSLQRSRRRRP